METRSDVIDLLENQRESLRQFGVRELGVFGSFARNEQTRDSDVDVLVDLENHTFHAYMDLLFFLEDLFGRKVDLVMKETIKPIIRNRILAETVYVSGL
jgi:predicted nucleotidyltransferase